MAQWTPEWSLVVNGYGEMNDVVLANLTITSGRTDIYSQPKASYCAFQIINLNETNYPFDVNDSIIVRVKDSAGVWVNLFGGDITDIDTELAPGGATVNQVISIIALGALSKLPKTLFESALAKKADGDQMYDVLSKALFNTWAELPPAMTWAGYDPTETWANAQNAGLGDIDRPGDYLLTDRTASPVDVYSLASAIATSGLGYMYEDSQGRICYADSTHRSQYLSANGYFDLDATQALIRGVRTRKRSGDVRNKITIQYKNNQTWTDSEPVSIGTYGELAQTIATSLENLTDAQTQADYYLALRAYPETSFDSISYELTNSTLDNSQRNSLLRTFMGQPVNITGLPSIILGGSFQGFVEGWTLRTGYNSLQISLNLSPVAFSLQAFRWTSVPVTEKWNTLNPTLDWLNATVVS